VGVRRRAKSWSLEGVAEQGVTYCHGGEVARRFIMRCSFLVLTMLLAGAGLPAQKNYRLPPVPLMASPVPGGCPVGFSVERRSAVKVIETKGATERRQGQGLEVKLGQKDAAEIVSAEVTVHGHSAKLRVLPVSDDTDASERFQITGEAAGLLVREIWMHRVNTVSWVDLNEIEYANGSVWRASANTRCRAVPSNFLLVSDGR
jgi:hypothetical protein